MRLVSLQMRGSVARNYIFSLFFGDVIVQIDNLGIDGENLKFVSISTIYEDNNRAIVVASSLRMTPTSKHIAVKYHWFKQYVGKVFLIRKIESENQKADIFTKGLKVNYL